jgi:hypothetical protein|tara:strand:- start:1627 stop:2667 length:1041 start_codon:yes stop_codon:yes gene_type:complete
MAFQRFNRANDLVENQKTTVSSGLWSAGNAELTSFYTQSTNGHITGSFLELYNEDPNLSSSAEVQFAVGYAHFDGSGSVGNQSSQTTTGDRQGAALYSQFRNVLLAPNTDKFEFSNSPTASGDKDFYFVSFQRARQREKIDPGNWELKLSGEMPAILKDDKISLIDDSGATTNPTVNEGGRVFNVVSGSIANGVYKSAATETQAGAFGLFYPDLGLILLNAIKTELTGGMLANNRSANSYTSRSQAFYNSIVSGSSFQARREEEISSTNYFCRVNNKNFNFSSNPTYATQSDGSLTQATFFKDPKTFITQVGLYNDDNELLAIAKLSKPLLKSYSREAIIKVKLDF